ncbi:MAG: MaoC family dehydratase [Rhodothalassiaceae bacterium]
MDTEDMTRPGRLYFEDFAPGQNECFGGYEVTEAEVVEFARKYDPQPFHIDHEAAKQSIFGRLCASGWHVCAMTMRMMVDHMEANGGTSLGSPGVDEIRWRRPVYPGDVLRVELTILETRRSRKYPAMGIVTNAYRILNQKDEVVMTFRASAFFPVREAS